MRLAFLIAAFVFATFSSELAASAVSSPSPSLSVGPSPTASPSSIASSSPAPAATTLSDFARSRIDAMLRTGHADEAWFSASFLARVPIASLDAILAQIGGSLGKYASVEGSHDDFIAHFANGTDEVVLHLDSDFKIDGLLFKPPNVHAASLEDALLAVRKPNETLSYVVVEGRSERASLDASEPLAVGSTFKLAVLAALRDTIARGARRWTDVVPLDGSWKSLPSGVMQTWPIGLPITLATYAAQMISISDNTAADALIHIVGPAALAPYVARNRPFLTTREMFELTDPLRSTHVAEYREARTAARRAAVLRDVDALSAPKAYSTATRPSLDLEWHFSVRELCALMDRVADLPVMAINPGIADATAFRRVAFKGGSDLGVLNFTTQVVTYSGTRICVSATLNDANRAVDDAAFSLAYGSVLVALEGR